MATGITVDFNANLARFTSAIDKATNDLSKFQSNADRIGKNVTKIFGAIGVAVSVGAVISFGKSMIDTADQLGIAAQKSGIAVEKFSALNYAAELNGLSMEQFSNSLRRLNTAIVGNDKVLDALGVSVKNAAGQLRGTDEVLLDVAAAFKALPDGAIKSEAAVKLFGKSGLEMIDLLNKGKDGITAFTEEAKAMGLVIGQETTDAAGEFNDNLDRMKGAMMGLANKVLPDLLAGLKNLNDYFGIGTKSLESGDFYKGLIKKNQDEIKTLELARKDFINQPEFRGAILDEKIKYRQDRILEYAKLLDEVLQKEVKAVTPKSAAPIIDSEKLLDALNGEKKAAAALKKAEEQKKANEALTKSTDAYIESLRTKEAVEGLDERQTAIHELSTKKLTVAQRETALAYIENTAAKKAGEESAKQAIIDSEALTKATAALNEEYGRLSAEPLLRVQAILAQNNPEETAAKQYLDDVELLTKYLEGEELDAAIQGLSERFSGLAEKNKTFAEEFSDEWGNAAAGFTANVGGAVADAILEQKKFSDLLRVSVKSMARELIAAFVSISARRAVDWAINEAFKAKSTASSVVANATIASTAAPGAAAVTLATLGANVPIALAGIAATFALSKLLGQAHDGLENVPRTGTYLLEGGERVVKKEDNQRLEKFLNGESAQMGSMNINFNVTGTDAPRAAEIVRSQKNQIIGIIQAAYNERGKRGGPVS